MTLQMGLIKIEINLAEIKKTIQEVKTNRVKVFEYIAKEFKEAFKNTFEELLESEITFFLGNPSEVFNKRNGYSVRDYTFKGIGSISLKIPRDRLGKFKSEIIPKSEQIDPRLKEDIAVLHLAGLSTRTLSLISKRVLGTQVSADTVSSSLDLISDKALKWLERPLEGKYWALYMDGTYFKIKRKAGVEREPNLVVMGIDENNKKSILAIEHGFKENIENWRGVFESLKKRGLDSSFVRIGIMDGLPGLEELFKEMFPNSSPARCWCHSMNNALLKTPSKLRDKFKIDLQRVMYASEERLARAAFEALKRTFNNSCQRAVGCIEKDLTSLLVHLKFDPSFHTALKTTNPIERINKEFKRRTKTMETVGESTLRCVLAFTALKLEMGWMGRSVNSTSMNILKSFNEKRMNQIEETMKQLLQ